ncbi:NAD-P-binding protein [Mycena rosella]|uniref:NAD-P-binding protein n=1 Tax=Mycena rosella TaxID=1033263 RepID=A0AAD7DMR5_MYCRO|nr:NAD-P-binding protein [Mycena rosella]
MPFGSTTTAEEVVAALADEIKGRNVLITGTSLNGLGFETARVIAKYANLVVITGYNTERLKISEDALRKEVASANIRPLVLDLASFVSVRRAAAEVNAYPENIDVLINNAAAALGPFKLTPDGFEQQLVTGHLGPFLFTALILPKILSAHNASYTPRVVYVSSGAHGQWGTGVNLGELEQPNASTYHAITAYAQTKSANILTPSELTRRAGGRIHAYSLSPGAILTNFVESAEVQEALLAAGFITEDGKPNLNSRLTWTTLPRGASTIIVAAFDPSLNDTPGAYLVQCSEANKNVAPHTADPVMAGKLWSLSERLVDVKFL